MATEIIHFNNEANGRTKDSGHGLPEGVIEESMTPEIDKAEAEFGFKLAEEIADLIQREYGFKHETCVMIADQVVLDLIDYKDMLFNSIRTYSGVIMAALETENSAN